MMKLQRSLASANYFTILFSFSGLFLTPSVLEAQIQGKVFRDFNANGAFDSTVTFKEIGLSGITVTAFNASGTSVGTTTTNATGHYTIPSVSGAMRVEFSGLATGDYAGPKGTGSNTSVQFVTSPITSVNYGVNYPSDYCGTTNPQLATPCYINGNPAGGGSAATGDVFVGFPFNATANDVPTNLYATGDQIGSTWGVAYQRKTQTLYTSAFLKRHVGLGPLGIGGIYKVNGTSATPASVNFVDVKTIGIDVGTVSSNAVRGLPADMTLPSHDDPLVFDQIGKVGMGDLDITDDGKTLFLTNLNDRKLYSIIIDSDNNSATAPTAADVQSFTIPNPGCTNGVARPFGIKIYKGKVYVGVVCTAENAGGTVNNMFAYIYAMDLATGVFNAIPVYSFPLNYPKLPVEAPDGAGWQSWTGDHTQFAFSDEGSRDRVIRPQPMLADIAFDVDGSMILTFIDRTGHQYGFLNYSPDGGSSRLYNAEIGGDILRVANVNGTFQLEHNGTAGALTGADVGNGGGPGTLSGGSYTAPFGEFYNDLTDATIHNDCSQGGSVLLAGSDKIAACFMDPINWTSGGIVTWSNTNGAQVNHYELYSSNSNVETFGKANGLGDLELLCSVQPLEIGNRVWTDTNGNGIQDGGEIGIDGVIVELYDGATKVGTTTTTNGGQYYFNNANVNLNGATELKPNTTYKIQIVASQFNNTGVAATPLSNLTLTTANATSTGLVDVADNDATVVSGLATISYTTGNYGENNHSLDFGFAMPSCAIALTTNVSGCYDSNGNTAGGSSVATVQAIVNWTNNPSGETINVSCTGAANQTIDPATATKPTILNFEVPANGSLVTVTTTFSSTSTCTESSSETAPMGTCLLTPCEAGNTGGTVWKDFDADGVKDAGETVGVGGVTVKAYDCNGNLVATTTTDYQGQYTFTTLTPSATNKYRLEFSNIPPQYQPTFNGTNGRTDVQFIDVASCSVNLGINAPADYCQNNPPIAMSCFINGLANGTTPNDALVRWSYDNIGATAKIGAKAQIGAVWGTAFHRQSGKLFMAAYGKRHVDWGPLGPNGLYVTTSAGTVGSTTNTGNFVNLNTINPAFDAGTVVRNLAGSTSPTIPNHDQNMYPLVGKIGLGDIEPSEDGNHIYVMNLNDRKLWRVEVGETGVAPTSAAQIVAYAALPNPCTNSTFRPFAVRAFKGEIYVGGVCDGVSTDELSINRNNVRATVYKTSAASTPSSAVWTTVLDYPLNFNRYANTNGGYGNGLDTARYTDANGAIPGLSNTSWHPWSRNFNEPYPSPMLMNLEFDTDGSMVLGFSDRIGDQTGHLNYGTNTADNTLYIFQSPGDILRAANVQGQFLMESNGKAGAVTTGGAGNGDGPGGGEFYFHDRYHYENASNQPYGNLIPSATLPGYNHEETSLGGLAIVPGKGELLAAVFDPQYEPAVNGYNSGGVRWYSNSTAVVTAARTLYSSSGTGTFGKTNGLGDIEALCNAAPLQVGNYVWLDQDKDGVQDPCEPPLSNIALSLWKNGVQIATTTTNSSGEYYFSSKSNLSTPANWTGTDADTTLRPSMAYQIKILKTQTKLDTTTLTRTNATTNSGNDQNDADASMVGDTAIINLTTGLAGSTNQTYDFGFLSCHKPALLDTSLTFCGSQILNLTTLVRDTAMHTKDSTHQRHFRYYTRTWANLSDSTAVSVLATDSFYVIKDPFACKPDTMTIKIIISITPSLTSVGKDTATCTAGVANSNAAVFVRGIVGMAKYAYRSNATDNLWANTATASTADSIRISNIANPLLSTTYTFRIWGVDTTCYNDTTVILTPSVCLSEAILSCGKALITCHATDQITDPAQRFVVAVMDTRQLPSSYSDVGSPFTNIWTPSVFHHADWTHEKLGNIYGATTDTTGNIYVTAINQRPYQIGLIGFGTIGGYTGIPNDAASIASAGAVYKLDSATGAPSLLALLPQQISFSDYPAAPGLLQIEYDKAHNQLFVSNREDGKIYRLSKMGTVLSTFDPLTADNGANGAAPNSELVWALTTNNDGSRLYYSINQSDVRSVGLTGTGDFNAATDQAEFTLPHQTGPFIAHIADLSFNKAGDRLLVSQRNQLNSDFNNAYNHSSMGYLYNHSAGSLTLNRTIQVGDDREGYGGSSFGSLTVNNATNAVTGQDSVLWFSAADILNGDGPHGIEAVTLSKLSSLASGNVNSFLGSNSQYTAHRGNVYAIDFDGNLTHDSKGSGGDIDIYCANCVLPAVACTPPSVSSVFSQQSTCTIGIANADAAVAVRGITGMAKYAYRTNATDSLWANTATNNTTDSIRISNIANPVSAMTYTFRIWGTDTTCYNDTTVILNPKDCFVQQAIVCGMPIDSLTAEQSHLPYNSLSNLTSVKIDNSILLGGERDVYFYDLSSVGAPVSNSVYVGYNVIDITNGTGEQSRLTIQWDGKDNDAVNLNPIGLGGLNFSTIEKITANLSADFPSGTNDSLQIIVELWSNSGAASSQTKNFKFLSGVSSPIEFKLSDLTTSVGSGVNLANIGAVVLKIDMATNAVSTRNGWDVLLENIRLVCPTCAAPLITSVGKDTATCTNGVINANAAVFVRGITGMTKYAYRTNSTDSLWANTATASTADSIRLSNLTNPSVTTTYTFRIWGADTTCYNDTTVILTPSVCPPCNVTATFTQNPCNNNGTTATGTDDYFTVTVSAVSVTNGGTSGKYEVVLMPAGTVLNAGGTAYGSPIMVGGAGVFSSNGATTYQLKVRDINIAGCETTLFTTTVSAACSTIGCPPQICLPVTITRF